MSGIDRIPVSGSDAAFAVACPACQAPPDYSCAFPNDSMGRLEVANNFVHIARSVEGDRKARAAAEAKEIERAKADAALLAAARAFPPGWIEAVAAVLVEGGKEKGCEPWESGGNQSFKDHLTHLAGHADRAWLDADEYGPQRVDPEDLTHAAARCALAWATRAK